MKLNFVCDRGSNFIKALKDFSPLYCSAHRLNNVLKKCFFQSKNSRLSRISVTPSTITDVSESTSSSDDDDEFIVLSTRMLKKKTTVTNGSLQMEFDRIPESAKDVIRTIDSSKKLVRYVKKVASQKMLSTSTYYDSSLFRLD